MLPKENVAKVLIAGSFNSSEIKVEMTNQPISYSDEVKSRIDEVWPPLDAQGFTAGPLVRINAYGLTLKGDMSLSLGITNYREFRGASTRDFLKKFGPNGIPNPPVVSCVIVSSDNKILIGQRKAEVHQAGNIDAFGGHIDPTKDLTAERIDLFKTAQREVSEEAKIAESEIEQITCMGLVYNYADTPNYALPFAIQTVLRAEEIRIRQTEELDLLILDPFKVPEHAVIDDVVDFLNRQENYRRVDPEARVTIALARKLLSQNSPDKRLLRPIEDLLKGIKL